MRLKEKQLNARKEIAKKLGVSLMCVPVLSKVTVNVGIGQFKESKDIIESIEKQLMQVTSQKPKKTIAKKSIAGFKVREGQHIGFVVTLRAGKMWDFVERLNTVVLARSREFEGIDKKVIDKNNNLTIAIKDQIIFPEIKPDDIKANWGMAITLTLKNAQNNDLVIDFLKQIGFVFK
ncbi:MAG: 50S ribosomal protein L5 [candidate division WS2 bacterium ADurb.Bin280]|uniref:50S ribosomal protein L5 n=1 Tax=candidate division WS2 bacterium ADurb.Bin280 TaxID=1852829 RepID=A0A1V5SE64_9BACT|nr:MAG: 50S ribosomal protein L5 [candidate division WS2 bacterium ADurb.Bin280]